MGRSATGLHPRTSPDRYRDGLRCSRRRATDAEADLPLAVFDYDAAGFRSFASQDDAGRYDLAHTALGQLRTRTHASASARSVAHTYDNLGRLTKSKDSSGSSHWEYDGATNGNGKLSRRCRMTDSTATACGSAAVFDETYTYNSDARLSTTTTKITTGSTTRTYTQSYAYDSNGRLSTMTYPSGLTVRHDYNSQGYPYRLRNDSGSAELITWLNRDAWGNATRERLGNGSLISRVFAAASGRQIRQDVRLKGKLRHDAQYEWRTDGLLKERSIRGVIDDGTTTAFRVEAFTHDAFGRMTEAAATSGTTTRTLTTAYDALGNLTSKTSSVTADVDITGYGYGGALNAVQTATVGGVRHQYDYDQTGSMTSVRECEQTSGTCTFATPDDDTTDRFIKWDGRGLASKVVVGSALTDATPAARETFRYGPGNARYERLSEWPDDDPDTTEIETQSVRTFYVGSAEKTFFESDDDVISVERTYLPGGVVHVKTTPTTGSATEVFEYRHLDHLGSASVVADASKTPVAVLGHDPFGERRRADWKRVLTAEESADLSGRRTVRGFTGHEQLDRTGLVHMNGRLYDPRLGRFLSPDPFVANPARSQDWNAYSYVSNSPMSYRDPTGFVRAGPVCNSVTVFCAAQDQGGGFTRTAQGFEHRGSIGITIPYVTVDWGLTFGGPGRHEIGFVPRVRVGLALFQVGFVYAGFLGEVGTTPADEPMLGMRFGPARSETYNPLGWGAVYERLRAANERYRARFKRGPGLYVTGRRVLGVGPVHLAIEYRDKQNNPETLSAFEADSLSTLNSVPNASDDREVGNTFTVGVLQPPEGITLDDYFQRLRTIDNQYNDQAPYDLFPYFDEGAYNSNSYVRGLIEATGGRTTVNFDDYYGGGSPLPITEYFPKHPP